MITASAPSSAVDCPTAAASSRYCCSGSAASTNGSDAVRRTPAKKPGLAVCGHELGEGCGQQRRGRGHPEPPVAPRCRVDGALAYAKDGDGEFLAELLTAGIPDGSNDYRGHCAAVGPQEIVQCCTPDVLPGFGQGGGIGDHGGSGRRGEPDYFQAVGRELGSCQVCHHRRRLGTRVRVDQENRVWSFSAHRFQCP